MMPHNPLRFSDVMSTLPNQKKSKKSKTSKTDMYEEEGPAPPIPATLTKFDWLGPADKGKRFSLSHPEVVGEDGPLFEMITVLDEEGTVKRGSTGSTARNWPAGTFCKEHIPAKSRSTYFIPSFYSLDLPSLYPEDEPQ